MIFDLSVNIAAVFIRCQWTKLETFPQFSSSLHHLNPYFIVLPGQPQFHVCKLLDISADEQKSNDLWLKSIYHKWKAINIDSISLASSVLMPCYREVLAQCKWKYFYEKCLAYTCFYKQGNCGNRWNKRKHNTLNWNLFANIENLFWRLSYVQNSVFFLPFRRP